MKRDPLEDIGLDAESLERKQRFAEDRARAKDPRPKAAPFGNQGLYDAAAQSARGFPGGAWAPRVKASAKDQTAAGAGASMRADTFGAGGTSAAARDPGRSAVARAAADVVAAQTNRDLERATVKDQMDAGPVEPAPVAPGVLPPPVPPPAAPPSKAGHVLAFVGGAILGALIAKALR